MNTTDSNAEQNDQSPISASLRLALIAGILTTIADGIATLAALAAIDEAIIDAEKAKQAQKELDDKFEKMQQQIDQLTTELENVKKESEKEMNTNSEPTSSDVKLISDLKKAINEKYTAIYCYKQLANLSPNDEMKTRILEIRKDEKRHYRAFSNIYTSLTGKSPSPTIKEPCETDFQNGVLAAFKNEQKAADFYQKIAKRTNKPSIKEAFTQASADEKDHAGWFVYFINHS